MGDPDRPPGRDTCFVNIVGRHRPVGCNNRIRLLTRDFVAAGFLLRPGRVTCFLNIVGGDRKGGPPLAREEPAGRGQEGPVGGAVARSLPPPTQDTKLTPEHGNLQVPVLDPNADEQAENLAQDPIQEEREHGRSLTGSPPPRQSRMSTARSDLFIPHAEVSTFSATGTLHAHRLRAIGR